MHIAIAASRNWAPVMVKPSGRKTPSIHAGGTAGAAGTPNVRPPAPPPAPSAPTPPIPSRARGPRAFETPGQSERGSLGVTSITSVIVTKAALRAATASHPGRGNIAAVPAATAIGTQPAITLRGKKKAVPNTFAAMGTPIVTTPITTGSHQRGSGARHSARRATAAANATAPSTQLDSTVDDDPW